MTCLPARVLFVICFLVVALTGCSFFSTKVATLGESSIELDYFRGGHQHRFVASGLGDLAKVELRERANTKQATIEKDKYQELLTYAESVVDSPDLKSIPSCRSPFILKVSREAMIKRVEGCRTSEEAAALGRLIRGAEFLLISND